MSTATSSSQLCTFEVNNLLFGVDVLSVQEVLRPRPLARVPLASQEIEGLINLRGQVVTTIDLRRRFGFPAREATASHMLMIVRVAEGHVGLLVDSVGDVIEVQPEDFERPPNTMPARARALVLGVQKLPGRLLHLLNVSEASELSEA